MKLGAHVSTSGGLDKAIDRAHEIGAETVQLFASSPRAWAFKALREDLVLAFREKSEATGISPAFSTVYTWSTSEGLRTCFASRSTP